PLPATLKSKFVQASSTGDLLFRLPFSRAPRTPARDMRQTMPFGVGSRPIPQPFDAPDWAPPFVRRDGRQDVLPEVTIHRYVINITVSFIVRVGRGWRGDIGRHGAGGLALDVEGFEILTDLPGHGIFTRVSGSSLQEPIGGLCQGNEPGGIGRGIDVVD